MTRFARLLTTVALITTGGSAVADVTAQDVRDNWIGMIEGVGQTSDFTFSIGSETYENGVLTVETVQTTFRDIEAEVQVTVPKLVFTENGDGTVSVTMSGAIPVVVTPADGGEVPEIMVVHDDVIALVSGTPEQMTYTVTGDRIGVEVEPGVYDSTEVRAMTMAIEEFSGNGSLEQGETATLEYGYAATRIVGVFDFSDDPEDIDIEIAFDGLSVSASGAFPGYILDGQQPALDTVPPVDFDGEVVLGDGQFDIAVSGGDEEVTGFVSLSETSLSMDVETGENLDFTYALSTGLIGSEFDVTTLSGEDVAFAFGIDGIAGAFVGQLPAELLLTDQPLPEDFMAINVEAAYQVGTQTVVFDGSVEGTSGRFELEAQGGNAELSLLEGVVAAASMTNAVSVTLNGFDIPFPVDVSLAEASYNMVFPMAKTDVFNDMAMGLTIRELAVSDGLWSLFDPAAFLPRDPVTVVFDLTGRVRPLYDIFDPLQEAEFEGEMPFELENISLNALEISAAGLAVGGEGAFTFDNTDLTTFDGMPRPEGTLTIAVSGANTLIDTLIDMGLLPQEQAMGARMMMGMFATPVGDDALESVIEINDRGHVIANGQRLQ